MKAEFLSKPLRRLGSMVSFGERRNIIYSHIKEQETPTTSSLDGDAEQGTQPEPNYQRPRSQASLFTIIFLVMLVLIQSFMLLKQRSSRRILDSPIPDFPTNVTSFERQRDWEFSPQAHDLWLSVLPTSGLIGIKHPDKYHLQHGLKTVAEDSEVYGLQVSHEIHCLRMMRESFYHLATRDEEHIEELYVANSSVRLPQGRLFHIFHCFDYLRQSLLCKSDMTIESRSKVDPLHIDGYGSPRICRNWGQVYEWMVENLPPEPHYWDHQ